MLTQEQRDRIEKLLLREREGALEALGHFEERTQDLRERSGEMSLYRFHMADIGTEAQEQEKDFLLASQEGRRLYEVDDALRRLYKTPEEFGSCQRCGKPIGFERLEVIPHARFCKEDQEATEAA
ncbi:MAG TPA: TraR/DksA C4-type zinc finger protein [Longimicrobiaceae bacterium]|nr:TraR/DksA C4-type zinc finger protein [Longimicrobiaceae bacterium]